MATLNLLVAIACPIGFIQVLGNVGPKTFREINDSLIVGFNAIKAFKAQRPFQCYLLIYFK
jgi:hypothetical protein